MTTTAVNEEKLVHYLPHRPVFKPVSLTTPIRPVFKASCKTKNFPSLNDCLEPGPNLIELIPNLIHRFRRGNIGMIADVRKAFQMINVDKKDRDFLRFLWWEDSSCQKLKEFRHCRVVFGVNSSPFLLAAVIQHICTNYDVIEKEAVLKLSNSIYVDNVVASFDNVQDGLKFKDVSTNLLHKAKMDLRQLEYSYNGVIYPEDKPNTTVLGLMWDKVKDDIRFKIDVEIPAKITRRSILSLVQKIFDPIGVLTPVTLPIKLAILKSWLSCMDWDEELKNDDVLSVKKWINNIKMLQNIKIPRNITKGYVNEKYYELHCFTDASQDCYAAAVFLRIRKNSLDEEDDGANVVQLIKCKSRLAPIIKKKNNMIRGSIPRLELMGCLIGCILIGSIQNSGMFNSLISVFYYTDSMNALYWIKNHDHWTQFIGNRVKEINSSSIPSQWNHVPGEVNPADLPSRGCSPQKFVQLKWWEKIDWMLKPKSTWPKQKCYHDNDIVFNERKKTSVISIVTNCTTALPYGEYIRNVKFMSIVNHWIKKSKGSPFNFENVIESESKLWKLVQMEAGLTIEEANKKGFITSLDKFGVIRIKTRLSFISEEGFTCPILLPNNHQLVDQLIFHEHVKNHHAGNQLMMSILREQYWIIRGRKTIRRVLTNCIRCKLFKAKAGSGSEAPLPENRFRLAKIFEIIGVDLTGHLYLKGKVKCWIVLFTCAVYRAIHLEVVRDLTTEEFLLAFSRFCSIRGRPSIIYSDNGTNFVGAANLFKTQKLQEKITMKKIKWNFNPPSSPWYGVFWERMIQEVKKLLKRSLWKSKLDIVDLITVLHEVSSTINNRPLTWINEDAEDLKAITPGMFLHQLKSNGFPEQKILDGDEIRSQYKLQRQYQDELKGRFRREYLGKLKQQWKSMKLCQLKENQIVLVGCDSKKRIKWLIGKIVQIFKAKDGYARVVKVKTKDGIIIRPIQKLYPLELEIESTELKEKFHKNLPSTETFTSPNGEENGGSDVEESS